MQSAEPSHSFDLMVGDELGANMHKVGKGA